jgi:succinate dehydrogenase/fumarate reductase flavoprotein subunit
MLANRSFGGAQVSRTFYAKGQTGQQLLLGAYSSLSCQVNAGRNETLRAPSLETARENCKSCKI